MNTTDLEKYLDDDACEIYQKVFFTNDELNELIVKDSLKTIINNARIKTIKDLLLVRLNSLLYQFNSLTFEYRNYEIDNTIDHMKYMLKKQYLNLAKLSIYINKTDDISVLKDIYLNLNAMIVLSGDSNIYFNNLLKMMEYKSKEITYISNYKVDLSINESRMNSITSNVKKLLK
ncbi:MAG: hypothetical protein J6G98_04980 [Bacilli bacterium]|nr:hypothetical protein [Bacilli bacterium]